MSPDTPSHIGQFANGRYCYAIAGSAIQNCVAF